MSLKLNLNSFEFSDFFHSSGLQKLDERFLAFLSETDPDCLAQLKIHRQNQPPDSKTALSFFIIQLAKHIQTFIADLFQIEKAVRNLENQSKPNQIIAQFHHDFILKQVKKELSHHESIATSFSKLNDWLLEKISECLLEFKELNQTNMEYATACLAKLYQEAPQVFQTELNQLKNWCIKAITDPEGQAYTQHWISLHIPERIDFSNLIQINTSHREDVEYKQSSTTRHREGFHLTDPRFSDLEIQNEAHYCIYCHDHEGDFCSKGFPNKKNQPELGFKKNPLGLDLVGCPLEEKISEMNELKSQGWSIAPLAVIMMDNPMCPATGHRICNDCMRSCIYQKQAPVNIPQIETAILTDVLSLPWGVEIYDLLTKWNPLRPRQYSMRPYNGKHILIAGMGPAGFTLAHHLLMEGCAVVGVDGLKIEPLNFDIYSPIHDIHFLQEDLQERMMIGFGGVAEYGITARWDKNFLKLIYLSLLRRPYFQVFGNQRFGGSITVERAHALGFDHLALAVGAGLPKALPIENSLAPFMRQANDFLMALQLGSAFKNNVLTHFQIRLPLLVIGGGLTGVDTATEAQAYYLAQVEKIYRRYHALLEKMPVTRLHAQFNHSELNLLLEYIEHAELFLQERQQAILDNRPPNWISIFHQLGGVTIVYRRSMQASPAYVHNHEELLKALEEGIFYGENLQPERVELNDQGEVQALWCEHTLTQEKKRIPAKTILVATGTQPNIAYEFEHRGTFERVQSQYQHYEIENDQLAVAHAATHCKAPYFGPFTSYQNGHFRVSLLGDTHPVFHGNVVKAIASGMRTYPKIMDILQSVSHSSFEDYLSFSKIMQYQFQSKVVHCIRKTESWIELAICAPLAALQFKPGQFFRLQNLETYAPLLRENTLYETRLQLEPLSLQVSHVDTEKGILTFLIEEKNASSQLIHLLPEHEPVALMGPTGVRAHLSDKHETILLIADEHSIPFILSYGKAARALGNHIVVLALDWKMAPLYDKNGNLFFEDQLKDSADHIFYFEKNIISDIPETNLFYQDENFITHLLEASQKILPLKSFCQNADRIFIFSNLTLLKDIQKAQKKAYLELFIKTPKILASIYGNMQCMLKGVCASCLQWQIDPETGIRKKAVFACSWQDQPIELIDLHHTEQRQQPISMSEKLNHIWVNALLKA